MTANKENGGKRLAFIGANNPETRRMMLAVSKATGREFLGFIDNDPEKKGKVHCGLPVLGGYEALSSLDPDSVEFVNLITRDCKTRLETSREVAKLGFRFANFIHPGVDLTDVAVGAGNYVQEGVIVQAGVEIGHNSSIHMGSLIGHESTIGSSAFVAHGVCMSGCVKVGDGVFIGTGAVILPRVEIGPWSTVGAGCVVTKKVEPGSVVVGNPGRTIDTRPCMKTGIPWDV